MLKKEDFIRTARILGCEPAALQAVQKVETGGRGGFLVCGKPTILFEGHIFWQQLKKRGIDPNRYLPANEDILYPKWTKAWNKGGAGEGERLERATAIHEEAALCSASWGMFQVMGFNYQACGEASVRSFVAKMSTSEEEQLILTAVFIRNNPRMNAALVQKDWQNSARLYNGSGYKVNRYDEKLKKAYEYYSSKK